MKERKFTYTKADGSVTKRVVAVVHEPSDLMLALDLTEFDSSEREYLLEKLTSAHKEYMAAINDGIGLKRKWRTFKESGIDKA